MVCFFFFFLPLKREKEEGKKNTKNLEDTLVSWSNPETEQPGLEELRWSQRRASPPLSGQIDAARIRVLIPGPAAMWVAPGCWKPQVQLDTIEPTVLVNNL